MLSIDLGKLFVLAVFFKAKNLEEEGGALKSHYFQKKKHKLILSLCQLSRVEQKASLNRSKLHFNIFTSFLAQKKFLENIFTSLEASERKKEVKIYRIKNKKRIPYHFYIKFILPSTEGKIISINYWNYKLHYV